MEVSSQPKLKFHGVDFVNIQFNSMKQYDGKTGIDFHINPTVFYPEDNELFFRIIMQISLVCIDFFDLKLLGLGNFELDKSLDDDNLKKNFVNANAPAIMFPYVRSFISTLSVNLGNVTGPLVIPTQFFNGELAEVSLNEDDVKADAE
jgi:preprotein translocase subunit SecB